MPKHVRDRGQDRDIPRSPLFVAIAATLIAWTLFGGRAPEGIIAFAVLALSGSVLLGLATIGGAPESWRSLPWPARAMILFFCLAPLVQLVPLPPAVWQGLAGRALTVDTLAAAGMANTWHPITLAVAPTLRTLLVTVWLAALVLALLRLSTREMRWIFGLILLLGLLNVAIGIVQVLSGSTVLQLYPDLHTPFLNGLFANKNHTGLFIALTFLAGYAAVYGEEGPHRRHIALVVPAGLVLFVALLATFSRAGVLFGLAAIAFLAWLSSGGRTRITGQVRYAQVRYILIALPVIGTALLAMVASTDLASRTLARFGGISSDLRWSIWHWSWPLVERYFPLGSGVGSFTAVFPAHERLAWVKPTVVNHVHNDYLEQLIELGIGAPLGWALVAAAVWRPVRTAWNRRTRPSGRLALIGAAMLFLIAVHSAFDYPMRRPAIAVTAMLALAALLGQGGGLREGGQRESRERGSRGKSRLRGTARYATRDGSTGVQDQRR